MDSDLDEVRAAAIREHLAICDACAKVCQEIAAIIDLCKSEAPNKIVPPNSQALWCRINNIIESELKPEPLPKIEEAGRRLWRFSFSQLTAAVVLIALISSVLTVVAIRSYYAVGGNDYAARSVESQTFVERLMARAGIIDTPQVAREKRIAAQLATIEFWNRRVQERRIQWDARMRQAFDNNLNVINESVNDYTVILQQNPEDDITGEMLDTALEDKVQLLRDFAEL